MKRKSKGQTKGMTANLPICWGVDATHVIAAYVFAASFPIPRPGPEGKITDAELVALAVAQAAMGEPSDRKFLGMIAYRLPGWFPHLPDQTQ